MPPWEVLLPESFKAHERRRRIERQVRKPADILHMTHAECLDGATCTLLHRLKYGHREVSPIPVHPHQVSEAVTYVANAAKKPRKLYISDLSVGEADDAGTAATLRTLKNNGWEIIWRDHHAGQWTDATRSLVEAAVDRLVLDTDNKFCASDLVQQELLPDDPFAIEVARVVRDRDLWLREDPRADDLACAMNDLGPGGLNRVLFESKDIEDPRIIEAADRWRERLERERREAGERTRVIQGNHRIGVLYGDYTTSDIAAAIRDAHDTEIEALMKPRGGVSLRAVDGIDISVVAREFDGGGHAQAAGCTLGLSALEYFTYWLTKGRNRKARKLVEALKRVEGDPVAAVSDGAPPGGAQSAGESADAKASSDASTGKSASSDAPAGKAASSDAPADEEMSSSGSTGKASDPNASTVEEA